VDLAKLFESLLIDGDEFSLFVPANLGLVCFTWRNDQLGKTCDDVTEKLFR